MPEKIWAWSTGREGKIFKNSGWLTFDSGESVQYTLTSSLEPLFKRLLNNPAISDRLKDEMKEILDGS
jgi:hypothetical protein